MGVRSAKLHFAKIRLIFSMAKSKYLNRNRRDRFRVKLSATKSFFLLRGCPFWSHRSISRPLIYVTAVE